MVSDLSLSELDDTDLALRLKPKRRLGKVVAGLAVLSLAGFGFMVVQSGGLKGLKLPALDGKYGQATAASLSLSELKRRKPWDYGPV